LKAVKATWSWIRQFFSNYIWIGVVMLLVAIILDIQIPSASRHIAITIGIKSLESIGIAVIIAAIFSFASGTSAFIEKIRSLLEDIIVKRNFLANIDQEGKKEALKSLIQPTSSESNKYPNIGNYYGHFISKTLEIAEKSVRSNYQITCRAYFDEDKGKIAVEGIYTYRVYPSINGFKDITVGFQEPEGTGSYCSYVSVSDPNGERRNFDKPELKPSNEGGDLSMRATIPIKDFGDAKNHLDVELNITEYGTDHWALIKFQALQPTDGFRFNLRCDGEVRVREHAIFVVGAKYYLDVSNCKRNLMVSCNQWINEGTGLCILVSIPHEDFSLSPPPPEEA
jgi:hypothetical protein